MDTMITWQETEVCVCAGIRKWRWVCKGEKGKTRRIKF